MDLTKGRKYKHFVFTATMNYYCPAFSFVHFGLSIKVLLAWPDQIRFYVFILKNIFLLGADYTKLLPL